MGKFYAVILSSVLALGACTTAAKRSPAAAAPRPETPAVQPASSTPPAVVTAEARGGEDTALVAEIRVEIAGSVNTLMLASKYQDCEQVSAQVETAAKLNDSRLRVVQLFCENGEDIFMRRMLTALVLATDTPRILWQGRGVYANTNDECQEMDVVVFRAAADGKVQAVRQTEVVSAGDDPECVAKAATESVLATIEIPSESSSAAAKPPVVAAIALSAQTRKAGTCTELVLRAERGGTVLAQKLWKDVCETCGENSCNSTYHKQLSFVDLGTERFAWIETRTEWHDNGSLELELWGYQCGKLAALWSVDTDLSRQYSFKLDPVGGNWQTLQAVVEARSEDDVDTERLTLRWDPSACKFVSKP